MIVRMIRVDRYCGPEELTDPRMVEALTVLSAGLGQQEFIPCEAFIFVEVVLQEITSFITASMTAASKQPPCK
jgi:hypothetical protein